MGESTGAPGWLKQGAMWKVHAALLVCQAVLVKASLSNGVDPFVFAVYRSGPGPLSLSPSPMHLLGAIAVLSGVYLITWGKVKSKEEAKQRNLLPAENPSYEPLDSQINEPLLIRHGRACSLAKAKIVQSSGL